MLKLLKMVLGGVLLVTANMANAAWPDRPVTLVVPFPPGGGTDIVGRLISKELSDRLGVSVVVENRPGAAGNIGARYVAKAKADGYTLLLGTTAQSISAAIYNNPGYDFVNDFESIVTVNEGPLVLFSRPNLDVSSIKDLVKMAKEKPGTITYASPGNGTSAHMAAEVFSLATGVQMIHVPYTGAAPAMNDVMSGQVDIAFDLILSALPFINSEKVKGLGIATKERYSLEPNILTLAEQSPENLGEFHETAWNVLMAPKGTPSHIVDKLNETMKEVLNSEPVKQKFSEMRNVSMWKTIQDSEKFVANDVEKWKAVVEEAKIQKQ